jgi:hypothetical protein
VIIVLQEAAHSTFKRNDADLLVEQEITLFEALCGFEFVLTHLDGRTLLIKSNPGEIIKPGDVKEIAGEGMPMWKQPFDKGLLIIKFSIKFPEAISPDAAKVPPRDTTPNAHTRACRSRVSPLVSPQVLQKVLPNPEPLPALHMGEYEEAFLQVPSPPRPATHTRALCSASRFTVEPTDASTATVTHAGLWHRRAR